MIWEKIDIDSQKVREISKKYGTDSLLSSILVRRNITSPEELLFFMEDDTRFLYNPFLFKDMEDVVDRVYQSINEEEKVLVFGDKDVDGVTSCVILYESLKKLGADASWRVPVGSDSYGLSVESVKEAYNQDISLIITVDCGISAFEAIECARELGIDVIVIDHHNSRRGVLPDATFIVNPKKEDCLYPFKGLAACGVVSKVLWALGLSSIDSLYKSPIALLNIEESSGDLLITVVKLYNLVEVERITINPDSDENPLGILADVLQGQQILVYNKSRILGYLNTVFGRSAEFNLLDIKDEILRILPSLSNFSLSDLTKYSRIKKYSSKKEFCEIDTMVNIFITYILKRYSNNFQLFEDSLDLVALGTIADLMPLKGENRILVKKGLKKLESTKRDGLRALLLKQNMLGKEFKSKDISWSLAPIINSAGRMKKANLAVELLLCEDIEMKNKLALDIVGINRERREITDSLWSELYNSMHQSLEDNKNKFITIYHKDMVKGVTGLIASRALSSFSAPAIIMSEENGVVTGSIRSSGNLNIEVLFKSLSSILIDFGGHNCAAGFSFNISKMNQFNTVLKKTILNGEVLTGTFKDDKKVMVDATIPKNYLNPDIIKICDMFEPSGEESPPLCFITRDVVIEDINFVGKLEKKHLRLLIVVGDIKWPCVFWNAAERVGSDFTKGDRVNILYKIERNFYGGNETLQLNIIDINI